MLLPDSVERRALAAVTLATGIGSGLYGTASVLYFTRVIHLPATRVGLGLSVAGIIALTAGIPIGTLADRRSPRTIYFAMLLAGGGAMIAFIFARGFYLFVLTATVATSAQAGGQAARAPLIRFYGGDRPQAFRAYLRSVTNAGIGLGAVLAGWAIEVNTRTSYTLLVLGNAFAFLIAALVLRLLPRGSLPTPRLAGSLWTVTHDLPYVAVTVLNAVMSVQYLVLTIAFPLWVVDDTRAPRWIVGAATVLSTAVVVCFQVRVGRRVDTPSSGSRAMRLAGLIFLVSCTAIALAAPLPGWMAAALLTIAVIIHTLGELLHAAAGFELSFSLAPEHASGQYLGLFGTGMSIANSFGPAILTAVCLAHGTVGWVAVGLGFVITGQLAAPVTRWAERRSATEKMREIAVNSGR